jgi:hypothetical protein
VAKIILSKGDEVLREVNLTRERITIGRRPENDVVIDDLEISGEHAAIVTSDEDSYLEDLNSTNGTQVNGQPVSKHFLRDGDVIELAQYVVEYVAAPGHAYGEQSDAAATIHVLNGPNAGKKIALVNVMTTLGRPGRQVAVIAQRAEDYYLEHVEGDSYPKVNGQSLGSDSYRMLNGDLIDLLGVQMKFIQASNMGRPCSA